METEAVVRGWLDAIKDRDMDRLESLTDPELVYRNWALPTIRGTSGLRRVMAPAMRSGLTFEYRIHRLVADGDQAMTERHDLIGLGRFHVVFWVCGVHTVRDGRMTLWHDRYDLLDVGRAVLRGLIGLLGQPPTVPTSA